VFYLGKTTSGDDLALTIRGFSPSILVIGASGTGKTVGVLRRFIETGFGLGYVVVYITIKDDFVGLSYPNNNPNDKRVMGRFFKDYYRYYYKILKGTWHVPKNRIRVFVPPFLSDQEVKALRAQYKLSLEKFKLPIQSMHVEDIIDLYGSKGTMMTQYFKLVGEIWQMVKDETSGAEDFLERMSAEIDERLEEKVITHKFARIFLNRLRMWVRRGVLTKHSLLAECLKDPPFLIVLYFPMSHLSSPDGAVMAIFMYTLFDDLDSMTRAGRRVKCMVVIDDCGEWKRFASSNEALISLVQRRGRALGITRILSVQKMGDLSPLIRESEGEVFDYRIETTMNVGKIAGMSVAYRDCRCHECLFYPRMVFMKWDRGKLRSIRYAKYFVPPPPVTVWRRDEYLEVMRREGSWQG